jgi:predicted dehydrogenase
VWKRIRTWLEADSIGAWCLAEFSVHRPEADRGLLPRETPWRGRRHDGRGGVLLDHGTHLVYSLMDLAGPPIAVQAWTGRLRHRHYDVEDTAQLILEYPGAVATILLTWAGHQRENHIRIIGQRGMIQWRGGALTLEQDHRVESVDLSAQMDKAAYAGWFGDLFAEFLQALDAEDGKRYLDDITQVAAVLEAAYASARLRRAQFVSVG